MSVVFVYTFMSRSEACVDRLVMFLNAEFMPFYMMLMVLFVSSSGMKMAL